MEYITSENTMAIEDIGIIARARVKDVVGVQDYYTHVVQMTSGPLAGTTKSELYLPYRGKDPESLSGNIVVRLDRKVSRSKLNMAHDETAAYFLTRDTSIFEEDIEFYNSNGVVLLGELKDHILYQTKNPDIFEIKDVFDVGYILVVLYLRTLNQKLHGINLGSNFQSDNTISDRGVHRIPYTLIRRYLRWMDKTSGADYNARIVATHEHGILESLVSHELLNLGKKGIILEPQI